MVWLKNRTVNLKRDVKLRLFIEIQKNYVRKIALLEWNTSTKIMVFVKIIKTSGYK